MNERAVIGGNAPPDPLDEALAPYGDAIAEAENWCDGTAVENDAQMRAVDALLADIKAAAKAVADADATETLPLHDAWKRAKARYKPTHDDLARIKAALIAAVDGYKRKLAAEKAEREAEARRKMWEAAEEARRASINAISSDLVAQREAAAKQAAFEEAQAAAKAAEADTVRGMRTYTVSHVLDYRELARWMWLNAQADMKAFLTKYAADKRLALPGVVEQRKEKRAV